MTMDRGEVADRLEIRDLIDHYATAVDARDADAFAGLFLPKGTLVVYEPGVEEPVVEFTGTEQLRRVMDLVTAFAETFHVMANHRSRVAGDTATGETYCLAHHLTEQGDDAEDLVMFIRYHDTYVRTEDGWRFDTRQVRRAWTEVHRAGRMPLQL